MCAMGANRMRRAGLAAQRCTATAKSTGERCEQHAIVGTSVCFWHGGGKRDVRMGGHLAATAAQLGAAGLPPAETVRLVQRALSEQMLDAAGALRAASEEGRPVSAEQHARFVDASDRALVAARVALAAGVEDQSDARDDEAGELVARSVGWSVDAVLAVLDLSAEQRIQLRQYALETAAWALQGGDPTTRPQAPKLLDRVAVAELLPAPSRRRPPDADDVWRRAQEVVDAELVDDQDDEEGDDSDEGGAGGKAA